jgi:hypothetical protein
VVPECARYAEPAARVNFQYCESYMVCPEYTRLAGLFENRRKAYAYIRLNQGKVRISEQRYEELVKEGYAAMSAAIKDLGWHKRTCPVCKNQSKE